MLIRVKAGLFFPDYLIFFTSKLHFTYVITASVASNIDNVSIQIHWFNTKMRANQIKIIMAAFKSFLLSKVCVETTVASHKYRLKRSTNASVRSTYHASVRTLAISSSASSIACALSLSSIVSIVSILLPLNNKIHKKSQQKKTARRQGDVKNNWYTLPGSFSKGLLKEGESKVN